MLIKYFIQHYTGSLWWVWEILLPSVLFLYLNSRAPAIPVHKPDIYIAQ